MVIEQALLEATRAMKAAKIPSPRLEANVLLGHILNLDRAGLLRAQTSELSDADLSAFRALTKRRIGGEPTAYLIGSREFMSLDFSVSAAVLIPRPDTEILVEAVIEAAKAYKAPHILDLCCGSGCIGVSLAHFLPDAQVTLVDVSLAAVEVSRVNAARHAPENTRVLQGDAFNLSGSYDMIVSNPPYIETAVVDGLQTEVRDHEPRLALDGGADGLVFYRHFAKVGQDHLNPGGLLALEVGHTQAKTVAQLLEENGWAGIQILTDLAGIERVVLAYKSREVKTHSV